MNKAVMKTQGGWVLAEAVFAIVLVGALLLVLMNWQQTRARQHQLHEQAQYSHQLLTMVQLYRRQQGEFPEHLRALVDAGIWPNALPVPGAMRWTWTVRNDDDLQLVGTMPNAAQAKWLAKQLPTATALGKQLRVDVAAPAQVVEVDTDAFLHRHAVAGKPELNRLQTNLSMQGHDLLDVGTLTAERINSSYLDVDALTSESLNINTALQIGAAEFRSAGQGLQLTTTLMTFNGNLAVQGDLSLAAGDILGVNELQAQTVDTEVLTSQQLHTTNLTAERITTDRLEVAGHLRLAQANIDILAAEQMVTETLFAEQLQTQTAAIDSLQAGVVYADVLAAQGHTLADNHQLLLSIQSLWDTCVDVGGCQ